MLRRLVPGLLIAGLAHAQIANFAIDHYTLPNGMEVITHIDRKAPVVYLNFRFRAGAKYEKPGHTGFAHLFEHLIYQGRDEKSDFGVLAERIGAYGGGTANHDFTEFYVKAPANRLERILWMESNQFAQVAEHLTQANLDRQREIVINELRQRRDNVAYGRVDSLMHENAFPTGHPYQHAVVGEFADLERATLEEARAWHAAHYTADQLTLAMVGDFDPAQAKQWVTKYFGSMAPGDGGPGPARSSPPLDAPRMVDLEDRVREEKAYLYWPAPPMADRAVAAIEFARFMLSDDASPRHLYAALTEKLATSVSADQSWFEDASIFWVTVTLVPGTSIAAIDAKVVSEMARLAKEGPSAEEMERARNSLEFDQLSNLETIDNVGSILQQVGHFYGGIDRWRDWAVRYSSITAEDVRTAVGRWLATPNHLTIHVRPQAARRDATPEPDRTEAPPFQPEKPYRAPEIESAKLPNGLQIVVMERHDIPKVAVDATLRIGALHNPRGKEGLAALTAATAGKGTANRKTSDIERETADLAITLHGSADFGSGAFGFKAPRKNLEPAFRLLADIIRNASYPEDRVEAMKKDWLDSMERPDTAELSVFSQSAMEAAFGAGHPLGVDARGTPASLRSVTAKDVRDFHDRYWKPDVTALIFSGDVTLKEAMAMATESLGSWSGTSERPGPMPPPRPKQGRLFLVDRKGATQTMVALIAPGIPLNSPDYPALLLADLIFGNMSASRLNQSIRQEKGIAYFALSDLWLYPELGLWAAWSQVQADRTAVAIREMEREFRGLGGEKPITAAEMETARSVAIHAFPTMFDALWPAAQQIAHNVANGLPPTQVQTLIDRIAALTLADVNAIARRYARVNKALFVLVGDREKIEPQVRVLGLGPVAVAQ